MKVASWISDFFSLLYPDLCPACGNNRQRGEGEICLYCQDNLPRTNYHLQADNPVEQRFWGKVPVFRATAFFFFRKGSPYQSLLHQLKYKGNCELGRFLGRCAAQDLFASPDFRSVDLLMPVPLHVNKLRKRGYNQSACIAEGLAAVLQKPIDTKSLVRSVENPTQTRKGVYERFRNTEGVFSLIDKQAVASKHILLIDDVLTTGSTLEACVHALREADDVTVSVFVLALA